MSGNGMNTVERRLASKLAEAAQFVGRPPDDAEEIDWLLSVIALLAQLAEVLRLERQVPSVGGDEQIAMALLETRRRSYAALAVLCQDGLRQSYAREEASE
jgi:hypothetical protein